jgi:hypothetical protein
VQRTRLRASLTFRTLGRMNTRLLLSICFVLLAATQSFAADTTPKIKAIDAAKREEVRTALQADISKGPDSLRRWFGDVCICAPKLWSSVRSLLDTKGIEVIPVKFADRDGAALKGAEANRRVADQLVPLLTAGKVRMLTDEEIKAYWRIYPFDEIEEPFFTVASPKADILVHLQWDADKGRYFVFLTEAFRLEEK